jgi:DNA-binding IclR family transcriptional regulator
MSKIVERTLDFLELFVEQKRPLSLSDISRLLKIPVSSCHDVLQSLQARGFMYEVSPRGGFYPTLRMYEAGKTIAENDPVLLRADHLLRDLRDRFDESVLLAKVSGVKGTYLLSFETTHALRLKLKVGDNVTSLHAASAGKAILGSLDDEALETALAAIEYTAFTKNTVPNKDRLRQLIREGQAKGVYINIDESMEDLTTISAPFHWQRSLYIVTMVLPTSRLQNRLPDICAKMLAACRKLEMKPTRGK